MDSDSFHPEVDRCQLEVDTFEFEVGRARFGGGQFDLRVGKFEIGTDRNVATSAVFGLPRQGLLQ